MIHLAELNNDSICVGVKTTTRTIEDGNHVVVPEPDFSYYAWRKYDHETETWSQEKFLPDRAAIQLDEFEQLKADKEKLELDMQGVLQTNAMNLKTMAAQSRELRDSKALNSDLLLKLARNGIN